MIQEFVDGILGFMRDHEGWAAPIAFLVAFGESLCFASIVWPGWAILVGFSGALAASGVSPDVLTPMVIAAGLGGTLGYALSYWIGLYFKDTIAGVWPFRSDPKLIPRGERFFERYGTWSVFLGHFVGPVRAVIPVVAGMFKMPHVPFQVANTASAFIWAAWAVLAPFWSIYYKDLIFGWLAGNGVLVAIALAVLAFVNSLPKPLLSLPTLILFAALGALYLFAGGSLPLALAAGTLGAFAGDLYGYYSGRSRPDDFHLMWTNSWSADSLARVRAFVARWGLLGLVFSKSHAMLRSFGPMEVGAAGYALPGVIAVSLISSIGWAGVLLSPRPIAEMLLGG